MQQRSPDRRSLTRFQRLQALSTALAATRSLDEVASVVVSEFVEATGAVTAMLVVRESESDTPIIVGHTGLERVIPRTPMPLRTIPAGPALECLRTGEPIWASTRDDLVARWPDVRDHWEHSGARSIATVPLRIGELVVGAMSFTYPSPRTHTAGDRAFLLGLGQLAALAVERARLLEREREAREKAERSERRYRHLFDASPLPTLAVDREGLRILDVNAAAVSRYGYQRDEFATLTLRELRVDDAEDSLDVDTKRLRLMEGATLHTRHRTRDGAVFDARISGRPVEVGGIPALLISVTDETRERRSAMQQRLLSDATALLASSLEYDTTLRHVVTMVVPAFADWSVYCVPDGEYLRTEIIHHADPAKQLHAEEILHRYPIRADEIAGAARVIREGRTELLTELPDSVLRTVARDDEHYRLIRSVGFRSLLTVPLIARGRVRGSLGFVLGESGRVFAEGDVPFAEELARRAALALENASHFAEEQAARAIAERTLRRMERLQQVTARLSQAVTQSDVLDIVVNTAIASLGARAGSMYLLDEATATLRLVEATGYRRELVEPFRTVPMSAHIPLTEAVRTREPVWVPSTEEARTRFPVLVSFPTTSVAWAALPLVVGERVLGVVAISFDASDALGAEERGFITTLVQQCAQALDRARLFEGERAATQEAQQANAAKSQFLAVMSHELRTPLNAIGGYAELMELELRGPLTDAQRHDLQRIRRSQHHLLALVNDVLNFARIEAGQVEYALQRVHAASVLEAVVTMILPQAESRRITLEHRASANGAEVLADPEKLKQIVLNLLSNAVKFTPQGGHITIDCVATGRMMEIAVRDTGVGIPEDRLEVIFDPFVQLQTGLTRSTEGSGLGLAISRDLARGMQGDLRVQSAIGHGSTFTVEIPLA